MEHYTIRNIARELDVSPEYLQVLIVRKTINIRQVDGKNSLYVASDLEINLLKKILKNYENMGDRKVFKIEKQWKLTKKAGLFFLQQLFPKVRKSKGYKTIQAMAKALEREN